MEVSETPSPAVQRRRLRAELRRMRLEANQTQEQVANAMDWSLSKLIRIENGSVGISTNDLRAILLHYEITDESRTSELLALSRAARSGRGGARTATPHPRDSSSSSSTRRPRSSRGTSSRSSSLACFRQRSTRAHRSRRWTRRCSRAAWKPW